MTEDEKALERFTRERSRHHNRGGFNLPDEDEEEQLTHLGKACRAARVTKSD